jgi:hypothetical protein
VTLTEILDLVGPLDDSPGDGTSRERFRVYLKKSVTTAGALRDAIETCLRTSGQQYARALQDLVNHCGRLLGFEVEFGRYAGVVGEIGHDGFWKSPTGDFIVAEVKTTDAYTVQTSTLLGYVDHLISAQRIPDWGHALGLYVVARTDAHLSQLTNAIIAEKRTQQLRLTSVDSLLSLAELMEIADVTHEEVLAILQPGSPVVDRTVKVIARVASQDTVISQPGEIIESPPPMPPPSPPTSPQSGIGTQLLLMTPVSDDEDASADDTIRTILKEGWYVFGDRTPGRKRLGVGDRLCFYRSGGGVVAEATVASAPEHKALTIVRHPEKYPWAFRVKDVRFFFEKPVVIDAGLRSRLDAFHGRDPNKAWAWFVQATRIVSGHDFEILVGRH